MNFLNQFPPGLRNIVILIGLMGMAQMALPRIGFDPVTLYLFYPDSNLFQPWQLVTHMFAHGGVSHFLFNVIALISFGAIIEYKLGVRKFLLLYFISGMGAVLLHFGSVAWQVYEMSGSIFPYMSGLIPGDGPVTGLASGSKVVHYGPMLGASGAIYGIMVAFAFFFPNQELVFLFIPYPIKAKYLVPAILGIDLIFGFSNLEGDPIAHFAHLGGAIAGFITVRLWVHKRIKSHWQ
jgi:rhomboid-like protein